MLLNPAVGKTSLYILLKINAGSCNVFASRSSYRKIIIRKFLKRTAMKRMLFTIIITACVANLYGQMSSLDDFFNNYSDKEGYTLVSINGNLFGLLKNCDEGLQASEPARKITSIRVVAREKGQGAAAGNFLSELRGVLKRGRYDDLITVKDHGSDLRFMVRSEGEIIREILVIASGKEEAVIQIKGNLTRDDVTRLSESNGDRLALLETLETSGK